MTDCLPVFVFTEDKDSDFRLTLSSKRLESENHAAVAFWGEIVERPNHKFYSRARLVGFPNAGMWDKIGAAEIRVFKPAKEQVTAQHEWVKAEFLAQRNGVRTGFNAMQVMR